MCRGRVRALAVGAESHDAAAAEDRMVGSNTSKGDAVGSSPRKQGRDSVKKVQESKDIGKSGSGTPVEDKRLIKARQRAIGRELKRFFDNVVEEQVPEDFKALLQQIDGDGPDVSNIDGAEDSETP